MKPKKIEAKTKFPLLDTSGDFSSQGNNNNNDNDNNKKEILLVFFVHINYKHPDESWLGNKKDAWPKINK